MMLLRIAFRNLWLHKVKTLIVGAMLFFGTLLVVLGGAAVSALEESMAKSVVNAVSGHVQIQAADAQDEITLFDFDNSSKDFGHIKDFPKVKAALEALPSVKTVVPMGVNFAVVFTGNVLDKKLTELREALRDGKTERSVALKDHIRRIVADLEKDLKNLRDIANMDKVMLEMKTNFEALAEARKDAFWEKLDREPESAIEFLENKVAPIAIGEDLIGLQYLGTDTARYQQTFDRFEIVKGTMIPAGQRGFVFNNRAYEDWVKNKTARRLDKIKERLDNGETIAECEDCQTWTKQNQKQAALLVYQMDKEHEAAVRSALVKLLGDDQKTTTELLQSLLDVNDSNFGERHAFFYDAVAPHIDLYTIKIGDTLVLTAYGKSGFMRKVPVKVYGTFNFKSLEKSFLAGAYSVMDLMTFRDLYGFMTDERKKENETLKAKVQVKDVSRDKAEDELFGADAGAGVESAASATFDETAGVDMHAAGEKYTDEMLARKYSQQEIDDGVVINAAVMLKDGVDIETARQEIEATGQAQNLGIKAVHWQKSAGLVGNLVRVISIVLVVAIFIIFVVALVIINNSLVMATLERTREIGTMRAIGAGRGTVMWMFMVESLTLAALFGTAGALTGATTVLVAGQVGVPAWSDFAYFLFAGPRLFPTLHAVHVIVAFVVIGLVGLLSTLYPALLATRIAPVVAMQKDD